MFVSPTLSSIPSFFLVILALWQYSQKTRTVTQSEPESREVLKLLQRCKWESSPFFRPYIIKIFYSNFLQWIQMRWGFNRCQAHFWELASRYAIWGMPKMKDGWESWKNVQKWWRGKTLLFWSPYHLLLYNIPQFHHATSIRRACKKKKLMKIQKTERIKKLRRNGTFGSF